MYSYHSKTDQYKYLISGVNEWILLLPSNVGLIKGSQVLALEVNSIDVPTGRSSYATIEFIEANGILTTEKNFSFYYLKNVTTSPMAKIYKANLTQVGTDAPVATVLENSTGLDFVFEYNDVGIYGLIPTGTPDMDKVVLTMSPPTDYNVRQSTRKGIYGYDVYINTGFVAGGDSNDLLISSSFVFEIFD